MLKTPFCFVIVTSLFLSSIASAQLFVFSENYLEADGRPSLLGFVLQKGKISEFNLNENEQRVLNRLQTEIIENWSDDYQEKFLFQGPDGVVAEGRVTLAE